MSIQPAKRKRRRIKVVTSHRLRQLEARVARLERLVGDADFPAKDPFVDVIGAFANEPLWDDLLAAIEEHRRQENSRED